MIEKYKLSVIILFLISAVFTQAQITGSSGLTDPVSAALGNTYVTRPDGIYSLGKNPANIAYYKENAEFYLVLPIPEVSVSAGTDFMNLEEFNYFFGSNEKDDKGESVSKYLTPVDVSRFKALFDSGNEIDANLRVNILSVVLNIAPRVGVFGFSVSDRASAKTTVPKDMIDLMDGNELGKTYSLNDLEMNAWYLREYSLSFAKDITEFVPGFKSFTVGTSLKLIHGFVYAGVENIESDFSITDNLEFNAKGNLKVQSAFSPDFGVKYDFEEGDKESTVNGPFPEPAGKGFGIDLGATAKMFDFWTFGLSITDIGSVNWNKGAANYTTNTQFTIDGITGDNEYNDYVDSLFNTLEPEGDYAGEFSTSLPTALHFGALLELDRFLDGHFPGRMDLYAEYHQGLNNALLNSLTPRFAVGADWGPSDWFAFRSGLSFGGRDGFNWSAGFGFDTGLLKIDLATNHLHSWLNGNSAKRLSVILGSRWNL